MRKAIVVSVCLAGLLAIAQAGLTPVPLAQVGQVKVEYSDLSVPQKINVQGFLTDTAHRRIHGTVPMTLKIWDDSVGGILPLWSFGPIDMLVDSGLWSVSLPVPAPLYPPDQRRWFEVTIDRDPLSPRIEFTSAAYSYRSQMSDTAGFALAAAMARPISPPISASEIAPDAIDSTRISDGSISRNDLAFSPGTGTVTSIAQDSGLVCTPNPISTEGTIGFDRDWGDARYINENQAAGGDLTGTYPNPAIGAGMVDSIRLAPGAVAMSKLNQAGAVPGQVIKWTGSAWAPGQDSAGSGSSGTVTSVAQGTGITCLPNPITTSGTASFDTAWGNAQYVNEGQANSISGSMIQNSAVTSPKIALPLALLGNSFGPLLSVTNASNSGGAVYGHASSASGANIGVSGRSDGNSGKGVQGIAPDTGGVGVAGSGGRYGVYGAASGAGGCALYGDAPNGYGVIAHGDSEGMQSFGYTGARGVGDWRGLAGEALSATLDGRRGGDFTCVDDSGITRGARVAGVVGGTLYQLLGDGVAGTIVGTRAGQKVMFGSESPEPVFEDLGTGQLQAGHARIELDSLFSDCIKVDEQHPLRIFVQVNDDCNGVYVQASGMGFDVYELRTGTSDARFSYRVVANRKDTGFLRFPDAPGKDQTSSVRARMPGDDRVVRPSRAGRK